MKRPRHVRRTPRLTRTTLALAVAATLSASPLRAENGITDLGLLNGGTSARAYGVSANGAVVVGEATDGAANNADRAFRWTQAGGMVSLGTLNGGRNSYAIGLSADGAVVVGSSNDGAANNADRAFRWTQAGGMVSLGTLNGGQYSWANGVSANGAVVVGTSADGAANNADRAFRWTQAGGMASLGTLNGGQYSSAGGVSADGAVVVGDANDGAANNHTRAFRWTQAGGMISLGTLNGGTISVANGVSGDGAVVVGYSADGEAINARAFRWTQAGGMVSLGTLNGGTESWAYGVSANGAVVVGSATDGAANNAERGFRWTQAGGMQSVEQWLATNGVKVAPGVVTQTVDATNADGSVVVGTFENNGRAYLARVAASGSGLIDTPAFNRTLQGAAYVPVQGAGEADLVLNGLHGNPLRGLPATGRSTVWAGGDWGRQENVAGDGRTGSGEIGGAYGFAPGFTGKLSVGRSYSRQNLAYDGQSIQNGTYLVPELVVSLPATPLVLSVSAYYNRGQADIDRGYENAGMPVKSKGSPDYRTTGLRLRADWLDAVRSGDLRLTPFVSLTGSRTRIDAYTETGGGFPVRWDARTEKTTLGRLGADATYAVDGNWTLLGRLEAVHRVNRRSAGASGEVLDLYAFDFDGLRYKRDWLRAGFGAEGKIGPGVASFMLNASSENNGPARWGYASYRIAF